MTYRARQLFPPPYLHKRDQHIERELHPVIQTCRDDRGFERVQRAGLTPQPIARSEHNFLQLFLPFFRRRDEFHSSSHGGQHAFIFRDDPTRYGERGEDS